MTEKTVRINGVEVVVPEVVTVEELKRLGRVPEGRALTQVTPSGSMIRAGGEQVRVEDQDYFQDLPRFKYGR